MEEGVNELGNEHRKVVTNVCPSRVHWRLECKKREKVAQEDKYWYQLYCGNRTI